MAVLLTVDPRVDKAFEFAKDSTKQLITLSTGIVALTITFAKDILGGVPAGPRRLLFAAWVVYLISIICGRWTLLALTGSLEPKKNGDTPVPSIRRFTWPCPRSCRSFRSRWRRC